MKKYLILLLLLVSYLVPRAQEKQVHTASPSFFIVSQSEQKIALSFALPDYTLAEVPVKGMKHAVVPKMDNAGLTLEEGFPELPLMSISLRIPEAFSPEVMVINSTYTDIPGVLIAPSPGLGERGSDDRNRKPNPEAYHNDQFYPKEIVALSTPFLLRSTRGVSIQVTPFQYNPVQQVLRVYHTLEMELSESGLPPVNQSSGNLAATLDAGFNSLNDFLFLNPAPRDAKSYSTPRMMVVAPLNFHQALAPFIAWKNQKGIDAFLFDATGYSSAALLKEAIKKEFSLHGLLFLVLVGDADVIPTFRLENGISDMTYAYLEGEDHFPDLFVGRISASTLLELETQINRFVQYEKNPNTLKDWFSNALGIASRGGPGHNNEYDYDHIRAIRARMLSSTYQYMPESYDGSQGGEDLPGDVLTDEVTGHINQGAGVIFYSGHADQHRWFTSGLGVEDMPLLTNTGMLPVVFSVACHSGDFTEGTCLGEGWLRANLNGDPVGAAGAFMSSGSIAWVPPMHAQDAMADLLISGEYAVSAFGAMAVGGCIRMNEVYFWAGDKITDTWVLFGDPSLEVRTTYPAALEVFHPTTVSPLQESIPVKAIARYAIATLSQNGNLIASAVAGQQGTGIPVAGLLKDNSSYDLVVTAPNRIPYLSKVNTKMIPETATAPTPVHHAHMVSVQPEFSWCCKENGRQTSFRLYLGTDNPPSDLVDGMEVTTPFWQPDFLLNHSTNYFWRIDVVEDAITHKGDVWSFSTVHPPDEDFEHFYDKEKVSPVIFGNPAWSVEKGNPFRGEYSARTTVTNPGEECVLEIPCTLTEDDFVGFWAEIECDTCALVFSLNGIPVMTWNQKMDWTWIEYPLTAGEFTLQWKYSQPVSTRSHEGAWLDDIFIPGNRAVYANAGYDFTVCLQDQPVPDALADGYTFLAWTTNGDGGFDDPNVLKPHYYPGPLDLAKGNVTLTLTVLNEKTASDFSDSITVYFSRPPEVQIRVNSR